MKRKLIIKESQLDRLKIAINESQIYSKLVKQIKTELDLNYEPIKKFIHQGGEYFEKPMILVKVDEQVISPKELFDYIKFKYKVNDNFIKQVIKDWVHGKISDDYCLSKNVSLG